VISHPFSPQFGVQQNPRARETVIDLAKKILGEKNVVVFKIVKKKQ